VRNGAWDVAHFVQERHIDVGRHVACNAWIPVPLPGTPDIGAALDDANSFDARLPQACSGQECGKSAADEHHIDGVVDRFSWGDGCGIRVEFIFGELTGELRNVLTRPFRAIAEAHVTFFGELLSTLS